MTNWRRELIRLSWKERSDPIPVSELGSQLSRLNKVMRGEVLTLEEESCLVSYQVAGKVLRCVHQAGYRDIQLMRTNSMWDC